MNNKAPASSKARLSNPNFLLPDQPNYMMPPDPYEGKDILYRYDYYNVGHGVDQFDEPYDGHTTKLRLTKHFVNRRTRQGAWIPWFGRKNDERFVLLSAVKKFACNSEVEALESFIARKKKQLYIMQCRIVDIEIALKQAEKLIGEDNEE